jgi:succinate-semialdehyde dehydrogenase / glutarate-semialdehyde dehydrogenase
MLKSVNPYKTTLIEEYEELSNDHIDKILHAADKAFYSWRELSLRERTEYIKKCADELQKNIELYAGVITTEMGKTIKESRKEINKCVMMSRYFIEHAHEFLSKEKIELEDGTGFKVYDPLGIILGIMPWNYPFWQFFRFAVPSLLAGNVIVLKHASNVPQSGSYIEEVFEKAGFPEGVMQNLMISSSKINRVIHDKRIRGISLTGSVSAGERVAEETGKKVKKQFLNLGAVTRLS